MREGNYDFAKTYEWMEQKYLIILQAQDRSSIIWGGGQNETAKLHANN